ncbi:MAG: hypothetical protein V4673_14380 [Pseudomonadota bacterium]
MTPLVVLFAAVAMDASLAFVDDAIDEAISNAIFWFHLWIMLLALLLGGVVVGLASSIRRERNAPVGMLLRERRFR